MDRHEGHAVEEPILSTSTTPAGKLEFVDVTKAFNPETNPVTILEHCSCTIEPNALTVVVGPSGCGKTTMINMIAGYDQPTEGSVLFNGEPVRGPSSDRLVVFQETALFPWMTVLQNVSFGPEARHAMPAAQIRAAAMKLLETVGLSEFADRFPTQLSGGMQRRAELARALINEPKLMLMDEPFRGLDAMTRELMQEHFLRLFEATHTTTFFVTSEIEEAIFLGDRLLLMSNKPSRVKRIIDIDLPRPREFRMLTSRRYQELWEQAMGTMHEEASKAFGEGTTLMRDMVEAMAARRNA